MEKSLLLQKVARYVDENKLFSSADRVLVALSGGPDSVALLRVLRELGVECVAAHCNFHLRGEESMRDERFVRRLCRELRVPLEVVDFDVETYKAEHGVSVEMACRELRYEWFETVRVKCGCPCVAVAHHRNDNIETFWLNALRGTGIMGLGGMKPRNGNVVRPLLCLGRKEIEEYLHETRQASVTDSTNLESDVKRNKLRNDILPCVNADFPDAETTMTKTIGNVRECLNLYEEAVGVLRLIVCDNYNCDGEFLIDRDCLFAYENKEMLLFEILKPFGFNRSQCKEIVAASGSGEKTGKRFLSGTHELWVERDKLEVLVHKPKDEAEHVIDLNNKLISMPVEMECETVEGRVFDAKMCNGKDTVAFSKSILKCKEVVLRHWRDGDRFRPFGMRGTKLLSDLFVDMKLRMKDKHDAWLMEADGKIVWVAGYRSSAEYAVERGATEYVVLKLNHRENAPRP